MDLRKAISSDLKAIWHILQFAIQARKNDGSTQWQDGYPNKDTILSDIENGYGYVIEEENEILIYTAIQSEPEPTYREIDGAWLTDGSYMTIHRLAVSPQAKGKGMAKRLLKEAEQLALNSDCESLRIDTHEDNHAMLHIIKSLSYTYCGQIYVRGEAREAFEKII